LGLATAANNNSAANAKMPLSSGIFVAGRNMHGERGISAGTACRRVNGKRLQARAPALTLAFARALSHFCLKRLMDTA
jgi:hypothetical protein